VCGQESGLFRKLVAQGLFGHAVVRIAGTADIEFQRRIEPPELAMVGERFARFLEILKQTQRYLNITDEELRKAMTGVWERRRQLRAVGQ